MEPAVFPKRRLLIFFYLYLAFEVGWDLYLYTLSNHTTTANYLFNIVYGSTSVFAALMTFFYIHKFHLGGKIASALSYLGLASACFGLALYIWAYYNLVAHIADPFPPLGYSLFIMYPILLTVGSYKLLQFYTEQINWRAALEAFIVFLIVAIPSVYYLEIHYSGPILTMADRIVVNGIILGTSLLVSVIYTTIRVGGGKLRSRLFLFTFSYLALIAADAFFQSRSNSGRYWNGDVSDGFFALHACFFALAMIYTLDITASDVVIAPRPRTAPLPATLAPQPAASVAPTPPPPTTPPSDQPPSPPAS